jgi:hypothetical protein
VEQTKTSIYVDTTRAGTQIPDLNLKLRVAEHIRAQYDYNETAEVRDILNETKPGAWRKPTMLNMLKKVFSAP